MAITVNNANLLFKDQSGNVGKVKSFTDADVTKISNAISTVASHDTAISALQSSVKTNTSNIATNKTNIASLNTRVGKIVDTSGNLIKATTSAYGVVKLASASDITAGTSGVVVTADQLASIKPSATCVTIDTTQTVTGAKTFTGATAVPTLAASNSGTGAASTACVDAKITAQAVKLSGNQTIAGTKTFSAVTKSATPSASSNTTEVATTAWVRNSIAGEWSNTVRRHNNIYRGANLLSGHFSNLSAILSAIAAKNFEDIYIGDYFNASFTYDGTTYNPKWRVAGIMFYDDNVGDAWGYHNGHVVIVPDTTINARMNETNTTAGGYVGSEMYTTTLPKLYNALAGASGTPFYGHIRGRTERLSTTVDTTKPPRSQPTWSGCVSAWNNYTDQKLTLLSEVEMWGHPQWSSSGGEEEMGQIQLPLFRLCPEACGGYKSCNTWLRSVAADTSFCLAVADLGVGGGGGAAGVFAVRPRFILC